MEDAALLILLRAVRAHDEARVDRMLRQDPDLARAALVDGATRQNPIGFYAGDTALHAAAAAHDPELIGRLIALGAEVNAGNRRGHTPLHLAAGGEPDRPGWDPDRQAAAIGRLADAGAEVNAADQGGVTPLHRAVRCRCAAAVKALLDAGAQVNARSGKGSTPLALTCWTTGRGGAGSPQAKAQLEIIEPLLTSRGGIV